MPQFAIRRVVLEYGALPIASWLNHIDSISALTYALVELRKAAFADGNRCKSKEDIRSHTKVNCVTDAKSCLD